MTPINKIMQNFRETNLMLNSNTPKETKEYKMPEPWMNIKTPETPLGAFLTPNPSPGLRKQWEYWLRQFPDQNSPKSTASTVRFFFFFELLEMWSYCFSHCLKLRNNYGIKC